MPVSPFAPSAFPWSSQLVLRVLVKSATRRLREVSTVRQLGQVETQTQLDGIQATLVVDARWRIAGWSSAAALLFGRGASEAVGRPCREVLRCRDADGLPLCAASCPVGRAVGARTPAGPVDGEILAAGAGRMPLRLATAVLLGPEEASGHVMILLRPRLQSSEAPCAEGACALDCQPLVRRALGDALDEALAVTGAEVAEVFLSERAGAALELAGVSGPCASAFRQITRFDKGEGFPGIVAAGNRPLLATDTIHDRRYLRTSVQDAGFRYYFCVPIEGVSQEPLGTLHIASRDNAQSVLPQWLPLRSIAQRLSLTLQSLGVGASRAAPATVGSSAASPGESLELHCFGRFSASYGGVALEMRRFTRRRALTILKILLTHEGRPVPRERLAELLWPQGPPEDAATLIKVAVHYLRRGLLADKPATVSSPYVITQDGGYVFNLAAPHWLDVCEFHALTERGMNHERAGRRDEALGAYSAALDLYTGDYLEDEPNADWCFERRSKLREIFLTVLRHAARLHHAAGDDEAAIRCHRSALAMDACLEEVHRELMQALWACGRRSEALRQFELCRNALQAELDVVPVPETVRLYHAILAGS